MKCSVILILLVNLAERFCFYTINGTQLFYMKTDLGISSGSANAIILVLQTACFLACLPGGILGDKFGSFRTVVAFACVYVAGTAAIAISTYPTVKSYFLFMLGSFGGLAFGSGGIKPNVPKFGADQLDDPEQRSSYFAYFYWMINFGSAVALGLMSTVTSSPTTFGIAEGWGYFVSYSIAAVAMMMAIFLFIVGKPQYKGMDRPPSTSLMRPLIKSVWSSARTSRRGKAAVVGWSLMVPFFALSFVQAFCSGSFGVVICIICFCIGFTMTVSLVYAHLDNSWLQLSPNLAIGSGLTEEESQMTFQGVPMLLLSNVVFNFAYCMMLAPFVQQSCQMNLNLGGTQLSGAVFNLGDCIAIIAFIPVFDNLIFPMLERKRGQPVTPQQKLVGGFFFAALAMLSAIFIEFARRSSDIITPSGLMSPEAFNKAPASSWACPGGASGPCAISGGELMGLCVQGGKDYCSACAPQTQDHLYGIYESNISAMLMFIPFAFIGIGEILVNPTTYFYAYTLTPTKTRSVIQAVNLVFQGALPPALVSVFTTLLAETASPSNLNNGHAEYMYYISICVIFFGTFAFFYACSKATVRVPEEGQVVENTGTSFIDAYAHAAEPHTVSFVPDQSSDLGASLVNVAAHS